MSCAVNDERTDVAIMVDPLSAFAELARLGRNLGGALSKETVASTTRETIERLFAPLAVTIAVTDDDGRLRVLSTSEVSTPIPDDPFFTELAARDGVVRHHD